MTTNVQKLSTNKEARENLKAQLAEYLSQQPESTLTAHKWMKLVDAAGLGIVITAFVYALYGSFAWANVNPIMIPLAWFGFAACGGLMAMLFGIHAILIRAFPPVILPGKTQKFVSGSAAVWTGVASIVGGLFMIGIWIGFAYSTATANMTMLVPLINILGVVVTVGVVISIAYSLYQKVSQSR